MTADQHEPVGGPGEGAAAAFAGPAAPVPSPAAADSGGTGPGARLLAVQAHDTAIDQLRHRLVTLPARAELQAAEASLAGLRATAGILQAQHQELSASQAELERQIDAAKQRRQQIEARMRSGHVTAARDLTAMDDEVRHLGEHVTALEDRELELMEALEPVDTELAGLSASIAALQLAADGARAAAAEAEAEIAGTVRSEEELRRQAAEAVAPSLLEQYERIRARGGGVGAAPLVGNACGGCHLTLPSMEVDRIRKAPPDTVVTCDQCGRILVR